MKKLTFVVLLALLMVCCTDHQEHSPNAAIQTSIDESCKGLSRGLIYTEHFLYQGHAYIRFHYENSDAVVNDPNCPTCVSEKGGDL